MVRCIELEVLSIIRELHLGMARVNLKEERKRGHVFMQSEVWKELRDGMGWRAKD